MNKYFVFRKLLDFVADHAEVTDADMDNYCGDIVIIGEDDESVIRIEVSLKSKEEKEDD
jgi:hypothetical protein